MDWNHIPTNMSTDTVHTLNLHEALPPARADEPIECYSTRKDTYNQDPTDQMTEHDQLMNTRREDHIQTKPDLSSKQMEYKLIPCDLSTVTIIPTSPPRSDTPPNTPDLSNFTHIICSMYWHPTLGFWNQYNTTPIPTSTNR